MSEMETGPAEREEIVARPGRYYRNARYMVVTMALLAGLWFAYDGWVAYPAERARYEAMDEGKQARSIKPHTDLDIALQKKLAFALIPIAPALLVMFLYRSRGAYRLSDTTLKVPGHPAIPLDAIVALDKSKWARKGIAIVDYQLPGTSTARQFTLDDFIYEQAATTQIVDRIEIYLAASHRLATETTD